MSNSNSVRKRRIELQGTPNFRDFGGYRSSSGQCVKWGYLYRSGQLSALSAGDVVMQHYMLTGEFFCPHREMGRLRAKYQMDLEAEAILPMLEVHEDYLSVALASIDRRYSSVEEYLAEELGVGGRERAELRGRYLG